MAKQQKPSDRLFNRFVRGFYTREDAAALFRFFRSGEKRSELSRCMDEVWNETCETSRTTPPEAYRKEASRLLKRLRRRERIYTLLAGWKYAAILILVLVSAWGVMQLYERAGNVAPVYAEVHVKNGEKRKVVLPDGSQVTLNAGSVLKYPASFSGKTRAVEMDGEAFFDVVRNERQPFVIHTHDADIEVLGTSFNVQAYGKDEQLSVCVKTGKVEVSVNEGSMYLLPDEELTLDKTTREIRKGKENAGKVTAWLNGTLYFNRTPVKSVAHQLERIYNCRIDFMPGFAYDEYIYGEHDNKSLESVLNSIRYSTDIKYKKKGMHILLYKE